MKLNKKLFTAGATLLTAFSLAQIPVHASNVTWKNDDGVALKSNWLHHYGNEYYFDHDGYRVEGLKKISGQTYFFNQDGVMVRNVQERVKGKTYFFNQAGEMVKDYYAKNGNDVYYYGKDGALVSDYWQTKNGKKYFYDETGLQWSDTTGMINGKLYYFDASGALATNKDIEFDGVTYHADKNGVLTEQQPAGFDESQINYDYALGAYEGSSQIAVNDYIIMHDVGAESGGAANARYLKNNWQNAYTQFVVGDGGAVYEVGEPGYVSWGALNANPYSPVQIELGRTLDRATFIKDYTAYVQVARHYADVYGIPKTLDAGGAGTRGIKTHNWVTENLGGSHVDPYGYLASWGIDYDQFAHDLQYGINAQQLNSVVYSQRQ